MTDVTDNFNRANGALGTNWSVGPSFSAPAIVSNQAAGGGGTIWHMAYWASASNTFSNDQHAQATAVNGLAGVVVRHQPSTSSGYFAFINPGNPAGVYRIDSGAFTNLFNSTNQSNTGDLVKLDITGSTLTIFKNGVADGTHTDATYTSGQPGIAIYDTGVADDWSGGPIVVLTQTVAPSVLYSDTDGINALTAAAFNTLNPGIIASDEIFNAPAIAAIAAALPGLLIDGDTISASALSAIASALPALYADDEAFYSANITAAAIAEAILSAGLFNDVDVSYAPNIANVLQFLRSTLLADRDRFYAQQIAGGNIPVIPAGVLTGTIGRRPTLTGITGRRSALTGSLRH